MAYSDAVRKLLAGAKAGAGDRLEVQGFQGVLLPRPDFGDPDCLVLKLDSGYNAGVEVKKGTKVKKLAAKKTRLEKFAKKKFAPKKGLPSISLIATGGTIAARVDYDTGGVKMVLTPEELFAVVPELAEAANVKKVSTPFTLASEDMTPSEWQSIAKETAKLLNEDVEGVVVTHGTDTLGYTAAALSFMLRGLNKPVALVGAQRSPDRGSFDGAMNLVCGARYACSDFAEVAVVMHATPNDDYCFAHRGTKVRKMHSTRRDAFKSVNAVPMAKIFPDGRMEAINQEHGKRGKAKGKVEADTAFEEKIGFVKAYPGSGPGLLEWFVDKEFKGVVVEAYALGHVPTKTLDKKDSWLPAVERAVEQGITVAFTSQCLFGRVDPWVYENLRRMQKAGAVYCKDMLPETAFVKLGWVLGHHKDAKQVKERLLENVAGEFNPRLTEKDFL